MSSSKKIDLQRYFAAGVYLSEAPSPPMTPYTLYSVRVYCIHIHAGKGGGGRDEGYRGNRSQSWLPPVIPQKPRAKFEKSITQSI